MRAGSELKRRGWAAVSLMVIVPVGFYTRFYTGPAAPWVSRSLGGVFYEIFWCVLIFLFMQNSRPWRIAVCVLAATCLLEFLQLWHPPFFELIRSTFMGQTVLGASFDWFDFPHYVLGCGIGRGLDEMAAAGRQGDGRRVIKKFRFGSVEENSPCAPSTSGFEWATGAELDAGWCWRDGNTHKRREGA